VCVGASWVAGVDIGATYTRVVIADEKGRILDRVKFETPRSDRMALPSSIARAIREQLKKVGASEKALKGIGVGSIGPLDVKRGVIVRAANLPLENVPIVEPLESEFGVNTYLVNDCVAAVVGEKHMGAGRGPR